MGDTHPYVDGVNAINDDEGKEICSDDNLDDEETFSTAEKIKDLELMGQQALQIYENLSKVNPLFNSKTIIRLLKKDLKNIANPKCSENENDDYNDHNHYDCTYIVHAYTAAKRILQCKQIVGIDKQIGINHMDIVCDGGSTWIKVKARNVKNLLFNKQKVKELFEEAKCMIEASKMDKFKFLDRSPTIIFYFKDQVPGKIVQNLTNIGIQCEFSKSSNLALETNCSYSDYNCYNYNYYNYNCDIPWSRFKSINLDISSLIALVSDQAKLEDFLLTLNNLNGKNNYKYLFNLFDIPFTNSDTEGNDEKKEAGVAGVTVTVNEKSVPIQHLFRKTPTNFPIVITKTALHKMETIVKFSGTDSEKLRFAKLMKSKLISIVPTSISAKYLMMELSHITDEHQEIFGTGDTMGAITFTSNEKLMNKLIQLNQIGTIVLHLATPLSCNLSRERIKL